MVAHTIYSCQIISEDLEWSTLPDAKYDNSSLVIIDGILTTVGGNRQREYTNSLFSLTGQGEMRQWSNIFPAMPTARSQTVSVTTQRTLIVAGGFDGKNLDTVEVMNIPTKEWTTASHLPHPFAEISGTICGDQLYLAGGYEKEGILSQSVLTCSVPDLLSPLSLAVALHTLSLDDHEVWRHAQDLPFNQSTLITFGGHLLAIGGRNALGTESYDIYCYDTYINSWRLGPNMKNIRYQCLAAALPEDRILVVGGMCNDSVEIGSLQ